jgi:hypothetical protein
MKSSESKTKNFEVYTYLLNYPTKQDALDNLDVLAGHLKRHKNGIISCIAQAEKNDLIFKKLIDFGYSSGQIPAWFLRPVEEKEELRLQPSRDLLPFTTYSRQSQPNNQPSKFPQPRTFLGMEVYDWDETQDYINFNQPTEPTFNDKMLEDMIVEYNEELWRNHQKEKHYKKKKKKIASNEKSNES